jgi:hypothetical protein
MLLVCMSATHDPANGPSGQGVTTGTYGRSSRGIGDALVVQVLTIDAQGMGSDGLLPPAPRHRGRNCHSAATERGSLLLHHATVRRILLHCTFVVGGFSTRNCRSRIHDQFRPGQMTLLVHARDACRRCSFPADFSPLFWYAFHLSDVCNTAYEFFLRHNRAVRKSKLKTQSAPRFVVQSGGIMNAKGTRVDQH